MIPFVLLAAAGYLALARAPAEAAEPAVAGAAGPSWRDGAGLARDRVRPQAVRRSVAAASIGSVAAAGAVGLIVLGAAPMAVAQASPVADTILAESINGSSPRSTSRPRRSASPPGRPGGDAGQPARQGSAADVPGRHVHDGLPADRAGVPPGRAAAAADTAQVELVAINYNPVNTQVSYIQAFDRQEGMDGVPNWLYLTGIPAQLQQVWQHYGVPPGGTPPAGSMVGTGTTRSSSTGRPHPPGTGLRPRPGHPGHEVLVRG